MYVGVGKNEASVKLRADFFNNFFVYQLKKFFITTKQKLIKGVTKERNMEWLAENKVKFIFVYNCRVVLIDRYLMTT